MLASRRLSPVFSRLKHTWIRPEGHDTGIKVYNCIVREKVPLIVPNGNFITWYTCGPTVYDSAHIGHACCYMKLDIIQRILKDYFKLNLITAMNVTDVDDKIINESKSRNKSPIEIARYYEKEYLEDLDLLGIKKPNIIVRVTDNMSLIVKFIKKLVDEDHAYRTEDGSVYFDLLKYPNYEKLQNISGENVGEATNNLKRSPNDFALWKAAKTGEPFWDSPFGPGRPGWHIECSALAGTLIGSTIDIHAGGIDLRFPHHENEEAQSCTYFQKEQWVNYWLHTGHLHAKDCVKMSKSLKNTISIREMLQLTTPNVFRMACLMSHYRNNMEYSSHLLSNSQKLLENLTNFMDDCNAFLKGQLQSDVDNDVLLRCLDETVTDVRKALQDDFDTSRVIKSINGLITATNKMLHSTDANSNYLNHSFCVSAVLNYVVETLELFGVELLGEESTKEEGDYADIMNVLMNFRQNVRQSAVLNKSEHLMRLCDNVREDLKSININIKDHGKVSSWSR